MLRFFRQLRQRLLTENKVSKYLLYGVGEILLVVIGILIALQINNANDARKERLRELAYLRNIRTDLAISIEELQSYIETRTGYIDSSRKILADFFGNKTLSFSAYNQHSLPIYNWEKYYQNNNTFQELVNSGNLALISNDSIKNMLLDLELLYKKLKSEEDHYRFDTEKTFYEPQYRLVDIQTLIDNYVFQQSNGEAGRDVALSETELWALYNNLDLKNGFTLTILEFEKMNGQMDEMIALSEELIKAIEYELQVN